MEIVQRLFLIALGLPEIIALFLAFRKTKSPYFLIAFIRAAIFISAYLLIVLVGVETVRDIVRVLFVFFSAISAYASIVFIRETLKK